MADNFREKSGKKVTLVAVLANCFLTVFNIAVGMIAGSSALVSEGAHTLSDIITTVIAYIGFKYSQKPADDDHPLGYARAEAISGLFIVLFLVVISWEIIEKASKQILFNQFSAPHMSVAAMAVVGIFINIIVSRYMIKVGKEIKSPAIIADGYHQKSDVFTSIAIVIGVFFSNIGHPVFDSIIAIVIGLLIFKTAVEIFISNVNYIIGKLPSKELIENIRNIANSVPNVQDTKNILVDYMGYSTIIILEIELDERMILEESHKVCSEVHERIIREIPEVKHVSVKASPVKISGAENI